MNTTLVKKELEVFLYQDIQLRPLNFNDLPYTLQWRNESRDWFNSSVIISTDMHFEWFKNYLNQDNDFVFIVQDNEGEHIGQAAVYNIDWENKSGEFGRFLVNPSFSGKGYMKKAVQAMLLFCKEKLKLNSLHLEVKTHNDRAIYIYKNAGFRVEESTSKNNLIMSYHFEPIFRSKLRNKNPNMVFQGN